MANHQQRVSFQPGRTLLGPTISTCWFHPVSSGHEPKAERREQQCDSQYCGKKNTKKKTKSPKCLSSCVAGCSQCSIHLHKACHSSVMFYRLEIVSKKFGMENFCEACSDRSNAVLFSWWSGARVPGPSNSLPSSCPFLLSFPLFLSKFQHVQGGRGSEDWAVLARYSVNAQTLTDTWANRVVRHG